MVDLVDFAKRKWHVPFTNATPIGDIAAFGVKSLGGTIEIEDANRDPGMGGALDNALFRGIQ